MINVFVEVAKNQKIVVDQIPNIINQNPKKIMENLIIYLLIAVVVACITTPLCLNLAYKNGKLKANFEQKVKELDAKDNTIKTQKDELATRKEEIEKKKKEIQTLKDELAQKNSEVDNLKKSIFNYQNQLAEIETKYSNAIEKITTLEEENQQLLTQKNTKKNVKRNSKN